MPIIFAPEKLTELRKLKGFSQEKLAEEAGINIRTLQRLEKGDVKPQPYTLGQLAASLGVTIEDLCISASTDSPITESKKELSLLHFIALLGCVFPLGNIIAPFLFWIYKNDGSENRNIHARAIINFHISWLVYLFIVLLLYFTIESFAFLVFAIPPMAIFTLIICPIISGVRVLNGKPFFYPLSLKLLKNAS